MQDVYLKLNPGFHIKSSIQREEDSCYQVIGLKKEIHKVLLLSVSFYGAETWTLLKVDQKLLKSFKMWCWRKMEKISWTDRVRNELLQRFKEKRNILQKKGRLTVWITVLVGTAFEFKLLKER